jgi:hypothetical protein
MPRSASCEAVGTGSCRHMGAPPSAARRTARHAVYSPSPLLCFYHVCRRLTRPLWPPPCSSCARAGYFRDDFIHLFVRKGCGRALPEAAPPACLRHQRQLPSILDTPTASAAQVSPLAAHQPGCAAAAQPSSPAAVQPPEPCPAQRRRPRPQPHTERRSLTGPCRVLQPPCGAPAPVGRLPGRRRRRPRATPGAGAARPPCTSLR